MFPGRESLIDQERRAARIQRTVLLVWLATALLTPIEDYAVMPHGAFSGFGVWRIILRSPTLNDWLLYPPTLLTVKWSAAFGCLLGLWPRSPRWIMWLNVITVCTLDGLSKAMQGYTNHAQFVPLFVLLVTAVMCPLTLGAKRRHKRSDKRIMSLSSERNDTCGQAHDTCRLAALSIIVPYTFVGITRCLEGGPALFAGDSLVRSMALGSHYHSAFGFHITPLLLQWPPAAGVLKAGFAAVTALEVTSILAVQSSRWRSIWLPVMTLFHVSTLVLMNIFFWENLLIMWAVFGPPWHIRRVRAAPVRESGAPQYKGCQHSLELPAARS